ncbi:PREDICTED: DC-STAMP domain-containing protein 1 [Thamnophis sirtalis]|uniref:DC-STAMP domain-containing protein 1 n=1 Tax=Thamnophis sirtalis TaxID=35019 RepID=A0A6I9YSR0_9SAUR|nr:PREDICTED: DC-STAMP domain-containing protein 1 [Thamnophis sirtalis]
MGRKYQRLKGQKRKRVKSPNTSPVANVRHNLGEVVRSISCTVELQIENSKKAWKISLAPMRKILKDMVRSGKRLRSESRDISRSFTELNKQVESRAGMESRLARQAEGGDSTQEVYEAKTRMRCKRLLIINPVPHVLCARYEEHCLDTVEKKKKRSLLPLRRAEESRFIDPLRLAFQPAETKSVLLELMGCLPPLVFLLTACALDSLLYTIFSTIRSHSFIQYSFRKCLPDPRGMSWEEYVKTAIPLGALVMLCFLQVYVFRIRRVIAAFYFPKREKKRIIYLYNEMLRQRLAFVIVQRKRIILRARRRKRVRKPLLNQIGHWCPFLKRFLIRRCILCNRPESRRSLTCSNPDCETVYCRICWKDLGQTCFACNPDDLVSDDESSDGEMGYAD